MALEAKPHPEIDNLTLEQIGFCGSYEPDDVTFVLERLRDRKLVEVTLKEKERLISSGERHYGEIVSREQTDETGENPLLYRQMMEQTLGQVARDCLALATQLEKEAKEREAQGLGPLTLVSLARGGTPIGVILRRLLLAHFGRDVPHYSVSIIHKFGLDERAIELILQTRPADGLIFVDGWCSRGRMAAELRHSLTRIKETFAPTICTQLYVVIDLAGAANVSASFEDYALPHAFLGANVSGLISRTVCRPDLSPSGLHACFELPEQASHDHTREFVTEVLNAVPEQTAIPAHAIVPTPAERRDHQEWNEGIVTRLATTFNTTNDRIKIGIGESSRAVMRRTTSALIVRDLEDPQIRLLSLLARNRNIPILSFPDGLPHRAAVVLGGKQS